MIPTQSYDHLNSAVAQVQTETVFSIVIPVFNRADILPTAIDSVIHQNFTGYELIVVDDGSRDEIEQVREQYQPHGVVFLKNEKNVGVGPTRNKGMRKARGQWVIFLDSDSRLVPGALSTLYSTIAGCSEKVGVVCGRSIRVGREETATTDSNPDTQPRTFEECIRASHIEETLPVMRRDVLLQFPYEENLNIKRECGILVWYAIGRAGYEFVWTREIVQYYETSPDGLSGRHYLANHPEEMIVCNQKVMDLFGPDLRRIDRNKFVNLQQKTGFYCIMANRRRCALKYIYAAWKYDPLNLRSYLLFALCAAGPRVARALYTRIMD